MEHIVQQADTKDTITIRDLKRISKAVMRKLEVERDDAKTSLLKEAMDYLEEQNWVTLLQPI
jgi:hypothetical protein